MKSKKQESPAGREYIAISEQTAEQFRSMVDPQAVKALIEAVRKHLAEQAALKKNL